MSDPLEELLAIVQRDVGAESVRVVEAVGELPGGEACLRHELPDGRILVASFPASPVDIEARRRRLEMLIAAFSDVLNPPSRGRTPRPPPARSLHEELAALAQRTGAVEALVIDAFSPVVWGSAGPVERQAPKPLDPPQGLDPLGEIAQLAHQATQFPWTVGLHSVGADDVSAHELGITSARGMRVDPAVVRAVPYPICAHYGLIPVARAGDRLVVAMVNPRDAQAVHDVVLATGQEVQPVLADESMTRFLGHIDDGEGPRTPEEALGALTPEQRAEREPLAARARDEWAAFVLARRAIAAVRELPEVEALHKGGQIRQTVVEPGFGYLARSFSAIYVVVLVFPGPFDEFLVKRALTHAMPTIERLVEALPPLDPPPLMSGTAAMRPPKRRR